MIFVPDSKTECNISAKVTSFEGIDLKSYPYKFQSCRSILGSENSALQTITVAADNPVLASEDGVLYTKDKSVLLACPPKKKSLIVAAETKQIGWGAANGCKELVLLSLPDGLERIYMDGFSGCTSLEGGCNSRKCYHGWILLHREGCYTSESLCEFRGRTICPNNGL
ncbi:MAG: hypothetical protein ACLTER_21435 [Ruminococcus sp.]